MDVETIVAIAAGVGAGIVVAVVYVAVWKWRYTAHVRRDAIAQSRAVTRGQVYEQLVPFLPEFPFNPKDAHFLGKPVDFVVFDGLEEGELRQVVLVEVKTGNATLTPRERQVRDAIRERRVGWAEIRSPRTDAATGGLPRGERKKGAPR